MNPIGSLEKQITLLGFAPQADESRIRKCVWA